MNPVVDPNPYEHPKATGGPPPPRVSYGRLWTTLIVAVLLIPLVGQAIWMPMGLAIVIVPVQAILLGYTLAFRRRQEGAVRLRVLRIGIYALALMAAQGLAVLEERSIETQAQELVDACQAFERDHGNLPKTLSELVPDYRPSIPNSLGLIPVRTYFYTPPDEDRPATFFYRLSPDAIRRYSFETHEWTSRSF